MLGTLKQICDQHDYRLLESPQLAIGEVVENLMNNSHYFLTPPFDLPVKDCTLFEVWRPSYYVGAIGGPATA